jgi:hypothetical protein
MTIRNRTATPSQKTPENGGPGRETGRVCRIQHNKKVLILPIFCF